MGFDLHQVRSQDVGRMPPFVGAEWEAIGFGTLD
jgi:hypothetical protein